MSYKIQTVEIENPGRHRILLHGGIQTHLDSREIRNMLVRHLYRKMKQQPAFIFMYDRPEDLHYPLGFTVARLYLGLHDKKYVVEVRNREGIQPPTDAEFSLYDAYQKSERESEGSGADSESVQNVTQFLYRLPVIRMEYTA